MLENESLDEITVIKGLSLRTSIQIIPKRIIPIVNIHITQKSMPMFFDIQSVLLIYLKHNSFV